MLASVAGDEAEEEQGTDYQKPDETPSESPVAGLLILLALVVTVGYGITKLAPDEVRQKANPGFLDNIFANEVVVAAARLVALFAAIVALAGGVYIVGSMVVRMSRGEWLRKAGPFESQVLEDKIGQAEDFFDDWLEAIQTNEDLEARLQERDEAIQGLLIEREQLLEALHEKGGA